MDLQAKFKSASVGGSRWYDVFDAEDPARQVRAQIEVWPGATGGYGFTAIHVATEAHPEDDGEELVESGQQNYAYPANALGYGLAELTAYYLGVQF